MRWFSRRPPAPPAPARTTTFTLSDLSSADATATVNSTTTVIDTDPAVAPTISGTVAGTDHDSEARSHPFAGVTIADPNAAPPIRSPSRSATVAPPER